MKWTIPKILEKRNISISELARMAQITYPTAQRLATGTSTRVDFETMAKVCQALDLEPGDLFELVP